jgi:hypothetical protein
MRTGYRIALAIAGATLFLAVVLFVIAALGGARDATAYGQISVPGRDSITLPEGEVIVFYGERNPQPHSPLLIPDDLRLRVQTTGGATLGSTPSGFDQFDDGDYVRRSIGFLQVPEAGPYESISPTHVPGAVDPVISFGRNGSQNFGYALFVLTGGLLLAAIPAVGAAVRARAERAG